MFDSFFFLIFVTTRVDPVEYVIMDSRVCIRNTMKYLKTVCINEVTLEINLNNKNAGELMVMEIRPSFLWFSFKTMVI